VSVFADVSDLRYFIEDACISVAPLRISVGIQNKILQSMAQRIPVVATTLGLGGIRAEPDKEILIADAPGEFAKKTVLLMQDVNLRNQIRQNAYRLVKEQYLWPDICGRLNKKLNALLQK
jgi:glycosyltransferase involved in cell wall biosynthesis